MTVRSEHEARRCDEVLEVDCGADIGERQSTLLEVGDNVVLASALESEISVDKQGPDAHILKVRTIAGGEAEEDEMLDTGCLSGVNEVLPLHLLGLLGFRGIEPNSWEEGPDCDKRVRIKSQEVRYGYLKRTIGHS